MASMDTKTDSQVEWGNASSLTVSFSRVSGTGKGASNKNEINYCWENGKYGSE